MRGLIKRPVFLVTKGVLEEVGIGLVVHLMVSFSQVEIVQGYPK